MHNLDRNLDEEVVYLHTYHKFIGSKPTRKGFANSAHLVLFSLPTFRTSENNPP